MLGAVTWLVTAFPSLSSGKEAVDMASPFDDDFMSMEVDGSVAIAVQSTRGGRRSRRVDSLLRRFVLSGGFGSGHRDGVVGEVGDELQLPAECLDVAGDGLDG
jgi:hypothetical protein